MANDYFSDFTRLQKGTKARADAVNSIFDQNVTGMDKLPTENQFNRGTRNYAVDTGAANAYVVSISHIADSYKDGQEVIFLTANGNTGPSTLNAGVSPVSIVLNSGDELPSGTIQPGIVVVRWNVSFNKWQLSGVLNITSTVSAFMATMLDDENAATARTTLEVIRASTSEVNAGTNSVKTISPSTLQASKRNIRYIAIRLVEATADVAVGNIVGGDFTIPFSGKLLQDDALPNQLCVITDSAGITGTMEVDVNINGASILNTNLLEIDTGDKSSVDAATQPDLTTNPTTITADDVLTFDVTAIHSGTIAKGLTVHLAVRED